MCFTSTCSGTEPLLIRGTGFYQLEEANSVKLLQHDDYNCVYAPDQSGCLKNDFFKRVFECSGMLSLTCLNYFIAQIEQRQAHRYLC